MREYVIVTDSTSDLTPELIKEFDITVIPMKFTIGSKTYLHYPDEREITYKEFYKLLRNGEKSDTALINVAEFISIFESIVTQGKDILYVSFSSALSGTYNSSVIAAEEIMEKYPDGVKIYTIDSRAASMGEGLLVYYAALKKREGKSIDDVREWLETNKNKLCHWFTVDDLNHLKRGGRISSTAAIVGTMLSIKPVLHVDTQGRLIPVEKVRGRKHALQYLVNHMKLTCEKPEEQVIFISHGDCIEDVRILEQMIYNIFKLKKIITNNIGPVIGSHSGPGTVALFFIGSEK